MLICKCIGKTITDNNLKPEGIRVPRTFRGVDLTLEERDRVAILRGTLEIEGLDLKFKLLDSVQNDPTFREGSNVVKEILITSAVSLYDQ